MKEGEKKEGGGDREERQRYMTEKSVGTEREEK